MSKDEPSAPEPETRSTHFEFAHSVFQAPEARFVMTHDKTPSMAVRLADYVAIVPLTTIRAEFGLEGTNDSTLLNQVALGLKFVKVIRPGDSIPREILDGSASWSVEDRHLEVAKGRITLQISSWLNGQEMVIVDQAQLLQLAEDPQIKARVNEAFADIAEKVGVSKQQVLDQIDHVAHELSYIEALRDRFGVLRRVQAIALQLMRIYRGDRTIQEELVRVDNLIRRPYRELNEIFDQLDAQCGEIISLLKNLEAQISFIRESRDELHIRMMLWDDVVIRWGKVAIERSSENDNEIRELYRFLARNYLAENPWKLVGKRFDRRKPKG